MRTDFTYTEYRSFMKRLKEQSYRFAGYQDLFSPEEPACMIRHDIDFDLDSAVPIARIEEAEGVVSTFCVMLRGRSYNPLSKPSLEVIEKILSMGHMLGLHLDCSLYGNDCLLEKIKTECAKEVEILEKWFGVSLSLVSIHKPSALILSGVKIHELQHPYEKKFMTQMTYRSDSCGFWRFGHPLESEAFLNKKPLNLCIHPEWWGEKYQSSVYSMKGIMSRKWRELGEDFMTNIVGAW